MSTFFWMNLFLNYVLWFVLAQPSLLGSKNFESYFAPNVLLLICRPNISSWNLSISMVEMPVVIANRQVMWFFHPTEQKSDIFFQRELESRLWNDFVSLWSKQLPTSLSRRCCANRRTSKKSRPPYQWCQRYIAITVNFLFSWSNNLRLYAFNLHQSFTSPGEALEILDERVGSTIGRWKDHGTTCSA